MVKNWTKVFGFVFRHEMTSRGYAAATIIVTILLLALIPAIFVVAAANSGSDAPQATSITRAVLVTGDDIAALEGMDLGAYDAVALERAGSVEDAARACAGDENAVIAEIGDGLISVILPENCAISRDDAQELAECLTAYYPVAAAIASGADPMALAMPVVSGSAQDAEGDSGQALAQEIIGMVLPYVMLMLMYFMVLIYSQGVASAAIVEKTSKLMDLFLVSIRPAAMMLGKALAIAASGIIQLVLWLAGAAGGVAIGAALVKSLYPASQLGMIALLDNLGGLASVLSPGVVLATVAMIIVGFLMYCALSAMGGALASKPEDLSTTNSLFSMALVISFLLCMFSGSQGGMVSADRWMNFVPFTAILVVPGRLMLGAISPVEAFASVLITAAFAFALILAAGKAYTFTAFYRGEPIKPIKFITSLTKRR
jgi:ABC-2 type transport system permease protein